MLFFAGDTSDYASNLEVQQLGVTFVPIVDHEKGLSERRFEEGIKIWRERRRERALLTLTVPGVDDGTNGGRRGMGSGRRATEEKRDERMSRRPVPPHSHHSDGALSRQQQQQQQQQQFQARQQQAQAQQQQRTSTTTTTTTAAHRTHPRPLQLQHKWNSESRQWEIVNTQQHYSSLRAPASPCSPTSAGSATAKERPWTADPLRLSPWSGAGEGHWVRAESEPPVSLHHSHSHHHSSHHAHDRHSSPAHGFGRARDVVWTPPLSVSSPEMEEDDDEDEDEDDDDEASEGSQGSGSTPSNW
ncbi:hypothetical protein FRC04_001677 [Tulasnella sp. 424]|nr:hypothetical protein FRC04_001677 [Tulasnella sp. 424]KAG8971122.1 hypothetical protein FRC05_011491 [Tulasnella sp. 425]